MELKREIQILHEQIDTTKTKLNEQDEDVTASLNPRIVKSMEALQEEIHKETKENSKLNYQVNELSEDNKRMFELIKAFFERVKNLNDFIGG